MRQVVFTSQRTQRGFTLIEIVIAIAILGIITVALLNSIVSGYVWIISSGNRTKAMAEAQSVMDAIYADGNVNNEDTTSNLYQLLGDKGKKDITELNSSLYDASKPDDKIFYAIETRSINSVVYNQVTILVFYQSGKQNVELTSLIP